MPRTYLHFSSFSPTPYSGKERRVEISQEETPAKKSLGGVRFAIARSFSEFEALESDWKKLFEHSHDNDQPFQSFNWNWHWCRNYLCPDDQDKNLRIVTLWENEELVMLWPMQVKTILGRKHLHFIGDPVSQYNDVLLDRRADRKRLLQVGWHFIQKNLGIDLAVLRKVKNDAILYPLLEELNAQRTNIEQGLYIDFRDYEDNADYQQRFKAKERKNRNRKLRRLQQQGEVRTVCLTESQETGQLARRAIQMKQEWLQKKNLLSRAFQDNRIENFFADVTSSTDRNINTVLSVLYVGDKEAAITISFGAKSYRAMHINVIDLQFEKDSPGVTLLENTIRHAMEKGDDILDFLAPADPYKKIWCNQTNHIEDFSIATNLAGRIYTTIVLKWVRQGGKNIVTSLPTNMRHHINKAISQFLWNIKK